MISIQRHVLVWALGASSLGALLLAAVAYVVILEEQTETLDANLREVAMAAWRTQAPPPHDGAPPDTRVTQPDDQIVIVHWDASGRRTYTSDAAAALPRLARSGLSRQRLGAVDWDVYTVATGQGVWAAAQQARAQHARAAESATQLLLPFGVLLGLVGLLLLYALRRGLQPLGLAAADVAARSAASLTPLDERGRPREIGPLVRAINAMMQRLASAFDAQRRFVADAAHELRTPVAALRLQLQLLAAAKDESARRAAIEELRAGIDRSQHLIEQLLSLSRAEPLTSTASPASMTPVSLAELVRTVVGDFAAAADRRSIDLGAQASDDTLVQGDREQLRVLLNNLVDNALRYTPAGGVVDVVAARVDGAPTLRVSDSGPGIAAHEQERVFERFVRGAGSSGADAPTPGSGLGLAIVRAIADRHGARVTLNPASGGHGLAVQECFAPGPAR